MVIEFFFLKRTVADVGIEIIYLHKVQPSIKSQKKILIKLNKHKLITPLIRFNSNLTKHEEDEDADEDDKPVQYTASDAHKKHKSFQSFRCKSKSA